MKRVLWALVGLAWFGCGGASDGYEVIYRGNTTPNASASEDQQDLPRARTLSIEAPRMTIAAMQVCADRYAPKVKGESFAVLFDVNVGVSGNSVKIKESMLDGSPLERCLVSALEQMDASEAIKLQASVSPQSRGMVGVVQAAAPIAIAPIALTAFGVTVLVGGTIYVISEVYKELQRCKQVKQNCIEDCSDDTLDDGYHEPMFSRCVKTCMEQAGCR